MKYAIEINGLCKKYKDFSLNHISLKLPKGSIMGLIGENGAGKSTLINAIIGNIRCEYESLFLLGQSYQEHQKEIKEKIGVIFDDAHYNENFTPLFIGKILQGVYRDFDMNLYREYLHRFQLPEKKKLKNLSRGMKVKVQFAAVLSHHPELLILDEATSGLDPVFREEILEILREFTEDENHSILISSHITSDLDKVADYIAYIHQGELIFVKSNDEIVNEYGIIYCKESFFNQLDQEDIIAYKKEEYYYRVLIKNKYEFKKVFEDVDIHQATIEDLMVFHIGSVRS